MNKYLINSLFAFILFLGSTKQIKAQKEVCIGFYNLENLFDTIDNPLTNDDEFTPGSDKQYTPERYQAKLNNMATVIDSMGRNQGFSAPDILGVCEVENRQVVEDLINTPRLKPHHYQLIHHDSPDKRGIDVALIYKKGSFKILNEKTYTLKIEGKEDFYTRDQLLLSGKIKNEVTHIIINHWPSRYGGEESSRPLRVAAAGLTRHIIDSLQTLDANARIIIMGDLNDDPENESVKNTLKAVYASCSIDPPMLYNPLGTIHNPDSIGSLCYRGKWNMFDQIILSPPYLKDTPKSYKFKEAHIYNPWFIREKEGKYRGYPLRTYVGSRYFGGYSDHFPVFIILEKL